MRTIWVTGGITNWGLRLAGEIPPDGIRVHAPWRDFRHAEELLNIAPGDAHYAASALTALKRCLFARIRHIFEQYAIDQIPFDGALKKTSKKLQQLELLGIVRPSLLSRLIEVRNAMEHTDADPPDGDRCIEFFDVVWYFLKSTDQLLWPVRGPFELSSPDGSIALQLGRSSPEWKLEAEGNVRSGLVSLEEINGWCRIGAESLETDGEHVSFTGRVEGPDRIVVQIARVFLEADGWP